MQDDSRADVLAEPRMGHGECRRLANRGVAEQRPFDIVGRDLLAAAIDDFLGAADDREQALLVDAAEVAGRQPAVDQAAGHALDIVETDSPA